MQQILFAKQFFPGVYPDKGDNQIPQVGLISDADEANSYNLKLVLTPYALRNTHSDMVLLMII